MTRTGGAFTTLRTELAPMDWAEIVDFVSKYARDRGMRWDDAARELANAAVEAS